MANSRPTRKYNCTQAELYAICFIIWRSFIENQLDFEAFKTIYTAQYGTDALQEIEDTKKLPDFQARNQHTETAYINLQDTAKNCLKAWRALRSYIKSSFPANMHKPEIEAAGEDHYMKALNRNWSETELMLVSALNYIDDKTGELTTGGMPTGFPTDVDNLHTEFVGLYSKFTDFEQDEHQGTDIKVNANNTLYAKTMAMCEDGQLIYEDNPAKQERFIFTRVKELITSKPTGTGIPADVVELTFLVSNAETESVINGANITIFDLPEGVSVTQSTNNEGLVTFKLEGFEPDNTVQLSFSITADEFDDESGSIEVSPGNAYGIEASLTPQVEP